MRVCVLACVCVCARTCVLQRDPWVFLRFYHQNVFPKMAPLVEEKGIQNFQSKIYKKLT